MSRPARALSSDSRALVSRCSSPRSVSSSAVTIAPCEASAAAVRSSFSNSSCRARELSSMPASCIRALARSSAVRSRTPFICSRRQARLSRVSSSSSTSDSCSLSSFAVSFCRTDRLKSTSTTSSAPIVHSSTARNGNSEIVGPATAALRLMQPFRCGVRPATQPVEHRSTRRRRGRPTTGPLRQASPASRRTAPRRPRYSGWRRATARATRCRG